jgi:hypothetical protein
MMLLIQLNLLLSFFICGHPHTITNTNWDEETTTLPRVNFGVFFRSTSILDNSNTFWHHTFKINLPTPPPRMPPITPHSCYALHSTNQTIQSLQEMCDLYDSLLRTYERQSTLLYNDIDDNLRTIHLLLENHKSPLTAAPNEQLFHPLEIYFTGHLE